MDPLSFLANVLLSVTVGTLTVAFVAYLAFRLREKRKPSQKRMMSPASEGAPIFLSLYTPDGDNHLSHKSEAGDKVPEGGQ